MSQTLWSHDPWARCDCGHVWLMHDAEETHGDGTDLCCTPDCEQLGCPGSSKEPPPELTEGDR